MITVNDLVKKRAVAYDVFKALAVKETLTTEEQADYSVKKRAVEDLDGQITRAKESSGARGSHRAARRGPGRALRGGRR